MSMSTVDVDNVERIGELGRRVLDGGELTRDEALWLFELEDQADVVTLFSWANRVRQHFKGNKIHLCSIVNVKAGGCPENCRFCAQSALAQTNSPRYGLVESEPMMAAAAEARANGVVGLGLVAAWRGLDEGPVLDEICDRLGELKRSGQVRADASLGIIRDQRVADRLKEAGCECYNHNLETSRRFFPEVCTTHTYDERVQTIRFLKQAGISICSGGILGMGETRADRCELAFSLKEAGAQVVPINIPQSGRRHALCRARAASAHGGAQVHRLFPPHPAASGNQGRRWTDRKPARLAKHDFPGGGQRAHGRQLSHHPQPAG